ncbi:hypothetical protein C8T65DRAFT_731748 [Cerioporus squamosus]|nr:hypothetical protein C8T65DRAFT_731748 [Cerioporus squamosus]
MPIFGRSSDVIVYERPCSEVGRTRFTMGRGEVLSPSADEGRVHHMLRGVRVTWSDHLITKRTSPFRGNQSPTSLSGSDPRVFISVSAAVLRFRDSPKLRRGMITKQGRRFTACEAACTYASAADRYAVGRAGTSPDAVSLPRVLSARVRTHSGTLDQSNLAGGGSKIHPRFNMNHLLPGIVAHQRAHVRHSVVLSRSRHERAHTYVADPDGFTGFRSVFNIREEVMIGSRRASCRGAVRVNVLFFHRLRESQPQGLAYPRPQLSNDSMVQ